jgi:hypothetical protein
MGRRGGIIDDYADEALGEAAGAFYALSMAKVGMDGATRLKRMAEALRTWDESSEFLAWPYETVRLNEMTDTIQREVDMAYAFLLTGAKLMELRAVGWL